MISSHLLKVKYKNNKSIKLFSVVNLLPHYRTTDHKNKMTYKKPDEMSVL